MLSMLTVLLYGLYLLVFSVFIALSILIIGTEIKEVKSNKPTDKEHEHE